jgi:purine-binding chemotaxis protein CheW
MAAVIAPAKTQNHLDRLQLVTFHVGDVTLGLPIECVQEINRNLELTPIPNAPPTVRGVINLRGEVVTVLDLHRVLGVEPKDKCRTSRNLIIHMDGEKFGLWVDRIADIMAVDPNSLLPSPPNLRLSDSRFVRGVHNHDGQIVVVLLPQEILEATLPTS